LRLSSGTAKPSSLTPFQPTARGVVGADLIAMNHGSILDIARENTLDAYFFLFDEFDIYNKGQLCATLEESVGSLAVTIDLTHTTFIDASILGVFVGLAVRCREHNAARVRIVNASAHLRRLFSICRLEAIFEIEDHHAHSGEPRCSIGSIASHVLTS